LEINSNVCRKELKNFIKFLILFILTGNLNAGYKIYDTRCKIQDTGYWMLVLSQAYHYADCFVVPPRNDATENRHCERSEAICIIINYDRLFKINYPINP
jgi:hypothetical protein